MHIQGVTVQSVLINPAENGLACKQGQAAEEFIVFEVGNDEFAIPFSRVAEIVGIEPSKPFGGGRTVELRGQLIPTIDLRAKFGLPETQWSRRTCVIIIESRGDFAPATVGIAVDGVIDVLKLTSDDIETAPDFGPAAPYASGQTRIAGKRAILLDIALLTQ